VPRRLFAEALQSSAGRALGESPAARDVARYLNSLHLSDLALACACAAGDEAAWEHFILEQRPGLYRAADAIDPGGSARELADSLYADLYGLGERDGNRQSLFRYFHGRSSLATWLRAVLAQRHVDGLRADRRTDPLPDDDVDAAIAAPRADPAPERPRWTALVETALRRAIAGLDARDRLRLGCYYAQSLTLAEIGRLMGEHEGTVSRRLTRVRRSLREDLERDLRAAGLGESELAECFASVVSDPGAMDMKTLLGPGDRYKETGGDRSQGKELQ
jgi:RNA polymerase sigma-70 factor